VKVVAVGAVAMVGDGCGGEANDRVAFWRQTFMSQEYVIFIL
jgi:hypothetical protein